MYKFSELTERIHSLEDSFNKDNLYVCLQDIVCDNGTFEKGTLVHLSLEGKLPATSWWSGIESYGHTLLKSAQRLRIIITDKSSDMNPDIGAPCSADIYSFGKEEEISKMSEEDKLTAVASFLSQNFSREIILEKTILKGEENIQKLEKTAIHYDNTAVTIVILGVMSILAELAVMISSKPQASNFMSCFLAVFLTVILFAAGYFYFVHKRDKTIEQMNRSVREYETECYLEWKNGQR